jgi:hypothetical protein
VRILKVKNLRENKVRFLCQRCYNLTERGVSHDPAALQEFLLSTEVVGIWNPEWTEILQPLEPQANAKDFVCHICGTDGKEAPDTWFNENQGPPTLGKLQHLSE